MEFSDYDIHGEILFPRMNSQFSSLSYPTISNKNKLKFLNYEKTKSDFNFISACSESIIGTQFQEFLNKYLPSFTTKKDSFLTVSKSLSRLILKTQTISKPEMEKAINFFYDSKHAFPQATLILHKENIIKLGQLLVYGYKKIEEAKIKTEEQLLKHIKEVINLQIDVIEDYNKYFEDDNSDNKLGKIEYWREQRKKKKYSIPPEFIFVVRLFEKCKSIKISVENVSNENELKYLAIILLNLNCVFARVVHFECDFSNESCLKCLYQRLQNKINKKEQEEGKFVQKVNYKLEFTYKHQWNFQSNYINPLDKDNSNLETCFALNTSIGNEQFSITRDSTSFLGEQRTTTNSLGYNDSAAVVKEDIRSREILNKFASVFDSMLLISYLVSTMGNRLKEITFHFSDGFTRELRSRLQEAYNSNFVEFHLYDIYSSYLKSITTLNLEFNCLSSISFEKVITIINNNHKLERLCLSLFPSEVNFQSAGLYRVSEESKIQTEKIFTKKLLSNQNKINVNDIKQVIINQLLPFLSDNLTMLFYLFTNKNSFKELSLFIDMPSFIYSQLSTCIMFLKFLINMLLLLNNPTTTFQVVKFLAPGLAFDSRSFPDIEFLLQEINYEKHNTHLQEFHLQIQLYSISNIGSLLSTNLRELTIGEFDVDTFINFIKVFTSQTFISKSQLHSLTVGLLGNITSLNQIKGSLTKLSRVFLRSIMSLNVMTYLIISTDDYKCLIDLHSFAFIKNVSYTFNGKTRNEIGEVQKKEKTFIDKKLVCVKYDEHNSECYYNCVLAFAENVNKRFGKEEKVRKGMGRVVKGIKSFLFNKEKINFSEHYN